MPAPSGTSPLRLVAHVAWSTVLLLVAATAAAVLAVLIARPSGSVTTFVMVQVFLVTVLVAWTTRWRTTVGLRAGLPAVPWALVPGVLSYLLNPSAWAGTALLGWQLVSPGVVSWSVDLLLWTAVVGLGVLWGDSQEELRQAPATPYG
ncbi:hypothetical protein [Aquipuribacter sp. MA13-6]|uniref:hypothetical protein n=1 Tax=unclassified Aquipuribacter TaxID=2635084 RepID=UPI003EEE0384